jgi:hypothetical protein
MVSLSQIWQYVVNVWHWIKPYLMKYTASGLPIIPTIIVVCALVLLVATLIAKLWKYAILLFILLVIFGVITVHW